MDKSRPPLLLSLTTLFVLLSLHLPVWIIALYAFTTDEATYSFPLPGLTTRWFGVALQREDLWQALGLSLRVAAIATLAALVVGTLAAFAVSRARFFGREAISFLLILPIALPGIVTGIALRSATGLMDIPFSFWTIVIGHATFCVVVVYNTPRVTSPGLQCCARAWVARCTAPAPRAGSSRASRAPGRD